MAPRVEVAPGATLPFLSQPHDTLRNGLPALKADAQVVHPVDVLQRQVRAPGTRKVFFGDRLLHLFVKCPRWRLREAAL